jgi:hypothetical protein
MMPKPSTVDDIREVIRRADEACRRSEQTRAQAIDTLKRPAYFPERRTTPRWPQYDGHADSDATR